MQQAYLTNRMTPVAVLILCLTFSGVLSAPSTSPGLCHFRGGVYKVGESFEDPDSCNTCFCEGHGGVACTEMWCPKDHHQERDVITPGECHYGGKVYKAGQGFKSTDGCNSCGCSNSGMVMCTLMACLNIDPQSHPEERDVISPYQCHYGGKVYKAGQGFKSTDGCNSCACSKSGLVMCTERACVDPNRHPEERDVISPGECHYGGKVYKAGQGFKSTDGCNSCACSKSGLVMCTERACIGPNRHPEERDVISPGECHYGGKVYKAGQGFKSTDGCNSCGCSDGGMVMCTEMACVDPNHAVQEREAVSTGLCRYGGKLYQIRDMFDSSDGCNRCTCLPKALISCTFRHCYKYPSGHPANPKGDHSGQCHYNGKWLVKGERTPSTDGCNTCYCEAGDPSQTPYMSCTELACPLG